MKDKEKQIEGIAKEICGHCLEMTEEKVCPYANTEDEADNEVCFTSKCPLEQIDKIRRNRNESLF